MIEKLEADLEPLQTEHDRFSAYIRDNALALAGTPEYRKALVAHRLITDLLERGGGTPEERAYALRKMNE